MSIESFIIDYLNGGQLPAGVEASGSVPHPMPAAFVTVEKTGAGEVDKIRSAQVHIDCWSTSRAAAEALCETVLAAMAAINGEPEISRCVMNTSYNNPSLATNKPRYSATFDVIHYF